MEAEFSAILTNGNQIVPHMRNEVLNLITFLKEVTSLNAYLLKLDLIFEIKSL